MRRVVALSVVLLGALAAPALAQTSDRGWVDLSFGSATPSEVGQTYTFRTTLFAEPAAFAAAYPELPRANGALASVGFRVAGPLGVGLMGTSLKYSYEVGLAATVPHPTLFNRSATGTATNLDEIERTDNAVDVSLAYQPTTPDQWRIRLFAGPTFFRVKQDFVQDIRYTQLFNSAGGNTVNITSYVKETVEESAIGFHAGADAAYFFSRYFGVGATVRFNRGTVKIDEEPLSEEPAELKVGSTIFAAGLRIRF